MVNLRWTESHSPAAVLTGLLVLLCLSLTSARAATIRVAQDGSGDYTSVFDGLAAAQDGDTVSIGPGTYSEMRDVTLDGRQLKAIGVVTASDVQVIGDDRDTVFIGPSVPPGPVLDVLEYGLIAWFQSANASFASLTVQNVSRGIADTELAASVKDCRILGTYDGTVLLGFGEARISDCVYESSVFGVIAFVRPGVRSVRIERCTFTDVMDAMQLQGVTGRVLDCRITGGAGGVSALDGAAVLVERTRFVDTWVRGAKVGPASSLWLYDNDFRGQMEKSVDVQTGALHGQRNRLAAGSTTTLVLASPAEVNFVGNHILNAGALTVKAGSNFSNPMTVSLAGNWWGTTDPEQIEAWILHAPDDPEGNGLTVEYQPIANEPIPTEESSLGRLKGRFSRKR